MTRQKNPAREEAKQLVGDGSLRDILKHNGRDISDEAIDIIIDCCSFVLKI